MYLTGFADEAADTIEDQIRATKELGWANIECRKAIADGTNLHDITDEQFEQFAATVEASGVKINCFGSAIANWAKKIIEPMDSSIAETRRAIPRMKRLGTKLVRIMSFAVIEENGPDDQMEQERFARVRELVKMFTDEGLTPVHENCMNYGGMGWQYTLKLIENVPGLKLVFDTGNPVFSDHRIGEKPYKKQSAWEFYENVREHIAYVHIKDGIMGDDGKVKYTFPGEGNGDVKKIVKHLLDNGYDGGISMEPHMVTVFHDEAGKPNTQERYDNYVEYGRRFMKLIEEVGHGEKLANIG